MGRPVFAEVSDRYDKAVRGGTCSACGGGTVESERFQTVARVGEVAEGLGRAFEVGGRVVALFLVDGEYYAIDDACPHQGFSLHDGAVIDRTVTCLWHGWRFDLADGRWLDDPAVRVGTFPVRVVGDEIQVAADETE